MVVNMTIQNADNELIAALQNVCKLHPKAKVFIEKRNSLLDDLKAEQSQILADYEKGTLRTFSSMDGYEAFHGL